MIGVLIVKDLQAVARNRAFRILITGYLLVFSAVGLYFVSNFLSMENSFYPDAGKTLFLQISVLQAVLVAVLSPWMVLRMHAQDLNAIPSAGTMAVPPWQVLSAKTAASALYLALLLSLGLPAFLLAKNMGAVTYREIAWLLADTFLFLMALILLVFHLSIWCRNWAANWILSYAALFLLGFLWIQTRLALNHGAWSLILLLLALLFGILLLPHGNRTLLYEKD